MGIGKLRCIQCGIMHKATSRKFPVARRENRKIEVSEGKFEIRPVIVGYLCWLCIRKRVWKEERKRAIEQQRYESTRKTIPSQEQAGRSDRKSGTDVPKSSQDNLWGRTRRLVQRIRGTFLQNHDQSRIPPKQPNTG